MNTNMEQTVVPLAALTRSVLVDQRREAIRIINSSRSSPSLCEIAEWFLKQHPVERSQ